MIVFTYTQEENGTTTVREYAVIDGKLALLDCYSVESESA